MKKWTYHHIFGALVCLAVGLSLLIGFLDLLGITLRTMPIRMGNWITICLFFGFTVVAIWLLVWRLKSHDRWWKKAATVLLIVALWLVCAYLALGMVVFSSTVLDSAVYTSPDGEHSICVTHEAFLAVEWNNVYEITSPITMHRVDSLGGGRPLKYLNVVWQTDKVEIISGDETVVVELP